MIKAIDYIQTGFSIEDVEAIKIPIEKSLKDVGMAEIDFSDVRFFTTLFFNEAITSYMGKYGVDDFDNRIVINNLTDVGKEAYLHSYEYGKKYYSLSEEERLEQQKKFNKEIGVEE